MDTPEFMTLTPEQEAAGMRLYRFLDQIVMVNKERQAVRRSFFPSRNAAKRNNHHFARLRELKFNPPNAENCRNEMVPDRVPQKPTRSEERLMIRVRDYERTAARLGAESFTKPGSMSK